MIPLERVPSGARAAWTRLRDELRATLGDDLLAIWGHGGTASAPEGARIGDLDTLVVVRGPVEPGAAAAIDRTLATVAGELGVEFDAWCLTEADARRPEVPRHAWMDRQYGTWAIERAHWLAGRYVLLHGARPPEVVAAPTADQLREALALEVRHLEEHVAAGDTDPYEATYAVLNGSRIVRTLETGDAAISKREAGPWGLAHLPDRWHPALGAAMRAYEGQATPDDEALLAREMAPYVAMVRGRFEERGG